LYIILFGLFFVTKNISLFQSSYHVEKNVFYAKFVYTCTKQWYPNGISQDGKNSLKSIKIICNLLSSQGSEKKQKKCFPNELMDVNLI
jgi:hypothetical protein